MQKILWPNGGQTVQPYTYSPEATRAMRPNIKAVYMYMKPMRILSCIQDDPLLLETNQKCQSVRQTGRL